MLLYEDHKDEEQGSSADHRGVIWALAFSPDGSSLVTGGKDGALFSRDFSGSRQAIKKREPYSIHSVVYAEENALVVGGTFGWHAYRKDSSGSWQLFGIPQPAPTNSLAMIGETTLVVGTGDRDKAIAGAFELWDLRTGRRREPRYAEPNGVRSVAACAHRKMVAWATAHRKICVWETLKQKPFELPQQKNCFALSINPEGTLLAAAVDYGVKVYNLERRYELFELKHMGWVRTVSFSPDGLTLATGSWDQTVKLWDARTGRERETFKWPIGRVCCLAFAPDGLRLAAGGDLGSVVVWDLE